VGNQLNVVFMGTPGFAVPSLMALNDYRCKISLVVTRSDQPKGRGRKTASPPVKNIAEKLGCPLFQVDSIKSEEFYKKIISLYPDLIVVVAFGHILPKKILEIPKYGAINVHASLLPKYRGPAPIQWSIINGETETGVTTMLMDTGLDTGEILLSSKINILPDDTAGGLHDRLSAVGADLLIETIKKMENSALNPIPQNHAQATYAPMLTKEDGHIDWAKSGDQIERFIRAMNPWPGAFTFINQKRIKIFKCKIQDAHISKPPGSVVNGFSNELWIATGKGVLSILEVQSDSGKRLPINEFLRGSSIPADVRMT
jgi:methionyl-tRNA formyltransferase